MEFLTTTEMGEKWNISRRRITTLCRDGRIEGGGLKRPHLADTRKYRKAG